MDHGTLFPGFSDHGQMLIMADDDTDCIQNGWARQ